MELSRLIRLISMIFACSVIGLLFGFSASFLVIFMIIDLAYSYQVLRPILAFDPFAVGVYTMLFFAVAGGMVGFIYG